MRVVRPDSNAWHLTSLRDRPPVGARAIADARDSRDAQGAGAKITGQPVDFLARAAATQSDRLTIPLTIPTGETLALAGRRSVPDGAGRIRVRTASAKGAWRSRGMLRINAGDKMEGRQL
jgi:hypothetical protein